MNLDDYLGRRFDLLAWCCPVEGQVVELDQDLFANGVQGVTGIQKLVQDFHLELTTVVGSVANSNDGCSFLQELYSGRLRLPIDVRAAFSRALLTIRDNLEARERTDTPDDERFDSAALERVVIAPGQLFMSIRVLSVAGTDRVYLAPLPVLPGGDD